MIIRLITALLVAVPASASAAWIKADSTHFVVYGDTTEVQLRKFVERLEKFDTVLRIVTGRAAETPPNKLMIFVVRDVSTLQKFAGPKSKNVYGFYEPQITGSFALIPRTAGTSEYDLDSVTVLYHEYAHHFMLQYFPAGYPGWYVEGFAEYFSTMEFRKDGAVAVGIPAKHRFASLIIDSAFPLTRMFAADIGKMSDSETSSFYSYAWLLTHYLRFEPKRKGQLNAYLRAFAAGKPPMDAATGAFGTVKDLENDLQRYMNSSKLSYSAISGITMPTQSIVIEALRAPESDLMPLYIRFLKPHDEAEIAKFVIDARAAAVKYPAEPRALELLAEGELDAEQLAAASKANDALLAIRATDARALLRHARIAAAQMRKSEDYPGGWKAVRSLIVKANRAAPNDPFPLSKYFDAYRSEGIPVPDLAGAGLNRALELSPQAGDLRFTLAAYLIEKDKRDEARIVLAPLLNEPHSPEAREMARRMLDPSGPGIPAIKESEEKNGKSQ